jgi:uncharacterized SAM-binding protein YcdF (DUF218 family)
MGLSRGFVQVMSTLGATVLLFVVFFFFLLPSYLGPNDLMNCTETPDEMSIVNDCRKSDAIVAISGGDTQARTHEAIILYQKGWASHLIFSGAAQDASGPSNAQAMKQQAIQEGVPEPAVIIEETSANTQQNAANTKALLEQHQLKKIILVTSAYHQRRASLEFGERAGSEVDVINHPVAHDKQWTEQWYLTTSGWWLAGGELVKIAGFYVAK